MFVAVVSAAFGAQKDRRAEVKDIRYSLSPDSTRIVIDLPGVREFSYSADKAQGRIYVDILQAKVDLKPAKTKVQLGQGVVRSYSVLQKTKSTVRLVLEVDFSKVREYRVFPLKSPFRIVIDVATGEAPARTQGQTQAGAAGKPADAPAASPGGPASGMTLARQLGLGVRTIVIDPGHGGATPGCVGMSGIREKDITLALCLALKKKLEADGYRILMTRTDDSTVPLRDRTAFANQNGADLYISIHVNASLDRKREGIETFYLNFTPDRTVIATAARENASAEAGIGQTADLIKKIAQNDKVLESKDLAEKIQSALVQFIEKNRHKVKSHGVKGGPFWVLIGGKMPSVLVEVAHLSNPKEEKLLQGEGYRALIVEGIYNGIVEYIKSLNKG